MNVCSFLINATDAQMCLIEQETELLEYEIRALCRVRGVTEDGAREIMCRHDILVAVHRILANYLFQMKEQNMEICPFKTAISCHLVALKREESSINQLLTEIDTKQKYIYYLGHRTNVASMDELRHNERGSDANGLINYMSKYFPYRVIFSLCRDGKFFGELVKTVLSFNPEDYDDGTRQYKECIRDAFQFIRESGVIPDGDLLQGVAIAETLVSFFLSSELRKLAMDPVIDFQFAEISRWMVNDKLSILNLKNDFLSKIAATETRSFDTTIKAIQRRSKIAYGYENTTDFVIPGIQHVIYELRRLTIQTSVFAMSMILWQAKDWLSASLSHDGANVGADESFQFFVAALAEAKLLYLPTILSIIKSCVLDDLMSSRVDFLITQLSIAEEFVKTRKTEVPPYILLPYRARSIDGTEIECEDTMSVRCFTLFAFPSYVNQTCPYLSCCTGNSSDEITLYKYKSSPSLMPESPIVDIVATTTGLLPNVSVQHALDLGLIRIDRPIDQADMETEVGIFSNLMLMARVGVPRPKISHMSELLENYTRVWRHTENIKHSVIEVAKEIQSALIRKRVLRMDHKVDGIIDKETVAGIRELIPHFRNNKFFIDPRIKSFVCKK